MILKFCNSFCLTSFGFLQNFSLWVSKLQFLFKKNVEMNLSFHLMFSEQGGGIVSRKATGKWQSWGFIKDLGTWETSKYSIQGYPHSSNSHLYWQKMNSFFFFLLLLSCVHGFLMCCVLLTVATFFYGAHDVPSLFDLWSPLSSAYECILAWHKKFLTLLYFFFSVPDVQPSLYLSFFFLFKYFDFYFMCVVFCLYVCLCTA